jgi:capsular polysaccharide transport system permease protein
MMHSFIKRNPYWFICLLAIVIVGFYQLFWASDRYVSEANVVLESPQLSAPTLNFQSLLSGGGSNNSDMLLLRDYLLSVDMLKYVDEQLGFRSHYSASEIDFWSALSDPDVPTEELHKYYLEHVNVELDDYAGVLRIKVSAFTPEMAHAMATLLLAEGEQHMNQMGQRLAEEQVRFLESQVDQLAIKFDQARQALIEYQNENGLISPTGMVESINAVVASLEAQLANIRAKRTALLSYQSPQSADVRRVEAEIDALLNQIAQERARTAQQAGGALNVLSSEYQTLELKVQFAQQSYSGALAALENTRIEAARKLKQVSVLQNPTLPV